MEVAIPILTEIKIVFVNGKIRLLPVRSFFESFKFNNIFQEDDAIEGFQSSQSKETWISYVQKKYSFVHRVDSFFRIISVAQASELKQAGRYDQRRAQRKSVKTHSNIRER